jgi:superfamily II DNA or RNA helicase
MCTMTPHHLVTGDLVRLRGDRWRVLGVAAHGGCAVAELAGSGEANRGAIARFLLPFESIERVAAPSTAPKRVRPVVLRAAARSALANAAPGWGCLRAASAARVTLLPYQLEPAIAMWRGLSCRFLLADAVGLGKTIQAGLLIAELLARERDARILIVTPAGLRGQWREELRDRFDIEADVFDAASLARATATLPAGVNPWVVPRVILTSIDFVKRPDVIRALEPIVWDLVAFDEAHGLAGRSDRATAAELLARRGRRVVAITATPHSGDSQAYDRLLGLGRVGEDDGPILIFRRSREDAGLAPHRTVRLLHVRLTGDEVALHRALDDYARRVFREAPAQSAPAARLAMMVLARRASSSAASLARSVERRIALIGAGEVESGFQLVLALGDGAFADDQAPDAELAARGFADNAAEARHLERIHALAGLAAARESKVDALLRILRRSNERAIVFTEYRDTLEYLEEVLAPRHGAPDTGRARYGGAVDPGAMFAVATLHGGMSAAEREHEARRFTHGDARLLLATDAASEGLNLQRRCRLVIHLEMPWTPLRLEQRIGRVDRLGQERRVHAIGLVGRGTAEESVVAAVCARATTADREAPFGGFGLRADAEVEAARLQASRALAIPRTDVRSRRHRRASATARPTVCLRRNDRRRGVAAIRLSFVDASGFDVWDTIVGADLSLCARDLTVATRLAATASSVSWPAIVERHDTLRQRMDDDVRRAIEPLIGREEAMLRSVAARRGRLAAPLVQPGLFDRRAQRDADAQHRMAEEAARAAAERVAALRRALDPKTGARRLVFAVI